MNSKRKLRREKVKEEVLKEEEIEEDVRRMRGQGA